MFLRKEKTGNYITMPPEYRNKARFSLFFGITGVGYEMLRYAFPDRIYPVI